MLTLNVQVPAARDRAGVATLRDGLKTIMTGPVVASATQAIGAQRSNPDCDPLRAWGHPPFGNYRLLQRVPARAELAGEYGAHLFLFEPESGQALDAESFGRLALLAYGGPVGRDGRLRRTQGGVRLNDRMIAAIVGSLRAGGDLALTLAPLTAPAWWQFWKRPVETMPLSATVPGLPAAPADEMSLIEALLMDPAVGQRRRQRGTDERRDRDDDRDDRRDRSRSSDGDSGRDGFQGRGGESAGGGASGGWDNAPGRGPGVDQAGRIVAGAAAAAGLAALANEAARAGQRDGDPAVLDAGGDAGSSGSSSAGASSGISTSTAY